MLGSPQTQKERLEASKEIGRRNHVIEVEATPILDEINQLAVQNKNSMKKKKYEMLASDTIEFLERSGIDVEVFESGHDYSNDLQYIYVFKF